MSEAETRADYIDPKAPVSEEINKIFSGFQRYVYQEAPGNDGGWRSTIRRRRF